MFEVADHCMVKLSQTRFIQIGGLELLGFYDQGEGFGKGVIAGVTAKTMIATTILMVGH